MAQPPTSFLADDTDPSDLKPAELLALIEASQGDIETFLTDETIQDALEAVTVAPVRERPDTLTGTTQRIDTGYDHIYVNINTDGDGRPFEVFTTYGQSGGFTKSFTEALQNLVTLALQEGADSEDIVAQLRGIRSPQIGYDHGTRVESIPDAIGLALERVITGDLPQPHMLLGKQASLDQIGDSTVEVDAASADEASSTDNDSTASTGEADSSHPTDSRPPSATGLSGSGEPVDETDAAQSTDSSPVESASSSSRTAGVPPDVADEISVRGTPDPETEPAPGPNAEPNTDPHLDTKAIRDPSRERQSIGIQDMTDTEPCPECGSIELFYSEGCRTCQSCGWSEC